MDKKIWNIRNADKELVEKVARENNLSQFLSTILVNRGLTEKTQIELFLNPNRGKFHNPFLMKDLEIGAMRIIKARDSDEQITIYGDYDVDGITSTSILYMYLSEIGCKVNYYIPNRLEEGYGVNANALILLKDQGTGLVITVDTGITAVNEAKVANQINLDLIITDHHECQEDIPSAFAIINPKRPDCNYPFDMLAGVGVTFKLIHGISLLLNNEELIWKYLDIVAVGTVADIVPLRDENRIITKLAFETIPNTWNIGLKALIDVASIKSKQITAGMIGFQIAPRLNAAGRLGDAKRGVALFTTTNKLEASTIAEELNQENMRRQALEQEIYNEAIQIVERDIDLENTKILVIVSENWNHGVIGIVASRIVEKYYRPAILLTIEEGVASGSARSVEGFSIFNALMSCKALFNKVGGHEMAAGMSLPVENIEELSLRLNEYAQKEMDEFTLIPKLYADLQIDANQIDIALVESLGLFEPYGMGNEEPKFICNGEIDDIRAIGKTQNHLKVLLRDGELKVDGIGFNLAEFDAYLAVGCKVDVLCTLSINEWQQKKKPQLLMKDIQLMSIYKQTIDEQVNMIDRLNNMPVIEGSYNQLIPDRNDYEKIYRYLLTMDKLLVKQVSILKWLEGLKLTDIHAFTKHLFCLEVFKELGLIEYQIQQEMLIFKIFYGKKVELKDSKLYNKCGK